MTTRRTLAAVATAAVVLLGASACGGGKSSGGSGSAAGSDAKGSSSAASAQDVAALPALSQAALSKAIIATKDLNGKEGAKPVDAGGAFISFSSTDTATPADCTVMDLVQEAGGDTYKPSAYADVKILEADATAADTAHYVHLSAYPGKTAQAFMDAVKTALPKCGSFKNTGHDQDNPDHFTSTVTPMQLSAGDDAVAYHTVVSQDGQSYSMTEALVRVGSTVVTFSELAQGNREVPLTKQYIVDKQVQKLRASATN